MKLLILTHNFPPRREISHDAGTFVLSFALSLSRLGHKVYVLMPDVAEEKENYPELKVTWFPWRGGEKKLGKLKWRRPQDMLDILSLVRSGVKKAKSLVREQGIEYCAAFWLIPGGYFAYRVKKSLGIPYSVWVLGSDIWTYGSISFLRHLLMKKVIKKAHRVFSNSLYLKGEVKKMFNREADLLYASRFLPLDAPEAQTDKNRINFLFIGRYEKAKGLDALLKAFRMLLNEKKDIYLYAFGGGELKDSYIEMVNELELKDHVSIGDYAAPEVAVSFLKACQCLIIPSRRESQPVLLMDAIQVKTPVIVTGAGDMGEIVTRFNIGEVVNVEDVPGLKDAMAKFIDKGDSEYRLNLEKASKALSVVSIAENYIESIKSI